MGNHPLLSDLLSAADPRWPAHHARSLDLARARVPPGGTWCLASCWRSDFGIATSWAQYDVFDQGLNRMSKDGPRVDLQALVAHYNAGAAARTRVEPWVFMSSTCKPALWNLMPALLRQDFVFVGEDDELRVITRTQTRRLGSYSAGAIASVIREASQEKKTFLGFDVPTSTPIEALARAAYVGLTST